MKRSSRSATLRATIAESIRAAAHHGESQASPLAVLWPDPGRSWAAVIPALSEALAILTFGEWRGEGTAQGPALWLRAALAAPGSPLLPTAHVPVGDSVVSSTPVIYLPGIRRDDLSDLAEIPPSLAPLADLVLRSAWWSAPSGQSPWTPLSFLGSKHGANLDLAGDAATRAALVEVLPRLLDENVESLRDQGRLDAGRLHARVVPDAVRTLLTWINDPSATRGRSSDAEWSAFTHACTSTYGFDPAADGHLTAARHLGTRTGEWNAVWQRFIEAPHLYPSIPAALDQARPQIVQFDLFPDDTASTDPHPDSWPSRNREQEDLLRAALTSTAQASPPAARERVSALASEHAARQSSVWGVLGNAPLAAAIGHLHALARATTQNLTASSTGDAATWYATHGQTADALALDALAAVTAEPDREAVLTTLHALYDPWVDDNARAFQGVVATQGYRADVGLDIEPGTCVVYVDALRIDLAHRLATRVDTLSPTLTHRLAAYPTLTPTGQPAVAPLDATIRSSWGGTDAFEAADTGGRALKGKPFHDALTGSGVQLLRWDEGETGDPSGTAWTQSNDIDSAGHASKGAHFEAVVDSLLDRVAARIHGLAAAGWKRIVVVTDHGFLLPARPARKIDLALALTEGGSARKPRVARLRAGAPTPDLPHASWTWDETVTMVSAPGAACFEDGVTYTHGGLSPQECVIPVITIQPAASPAEAAIAVHIDQVRWTGQRCRIDIAPAGVAVLGTLRLRPADPSSNLAEPKSPTADGEIKLLVDEDDAPEGTSAYVVLLDAEGLIIAQHQTVVGGDR